MAVYVLAQMSIKDRPKYDRYAAQFMRTLAGFDGRLLAADESVRVVEGSWCFDKIVLLEFRNVRAYEDWARSPAYSAIAVDRKASTDGNVLLIRGLADSK